MWIFLLALIALGFISWFASKYNGFASKNESSIPDQPSAPPVVPNAIEEEEEEACCGAYEVCEKDTLILFDSKIEYYDDEELDACSGRTASSFTDEELNLFDHVFFTLQSEDVAGWLRSLQLRNIELPESLKEEALLIVSERRQTAQ